MLLKYDDNTFIEYDPLTDRTTALKLDALNTELSFCEAKIAEVPQPPTDDELLAWARENYKPEIDYSEQLRVNTERKDEITRILNEISAL